MANKSRFVIAEGSIKNYFKGHSTKVFSRIKLHEIFEEKRTAWNLPVSLYADKFIEQLLKKEIVKKIELPFEGYLSDKELFISEQASIFTIAAALINKSYLSHYSAVLLNGLTTQVPKIVYLTFEQSQKAGQKGSLTQEAIDAAFEKPQRKSGAQVSYEEYTIIVLNGMYTGRAGVYTPSDVAVTNLERTLIDITVRPNYAGGVSAVLEAYEKALPNLSVNKLIATLDKMNFIYPYHQAVGFYLERAGYTGKKLDELKRRPKVFDFYLTYQIVEKDYSHEWRLYFPKGM